jgi:hypothetical protein
MRTSWFAISFLISACGASGTSAPGLPTPDVYVDQKIYKDKEKGIVSDWEYNIYSKALGAVAPRVMIEFWFPEPVPYPQPSSYTVVVRRKTASSFSVWLDKCTLDTDPDSSERAKMRAWNKANPKSEIEIGESRRRVQCQIGTVGSSYLDDITDVWLMSG